MIKMIPDYSAHYSGNYQGAVLGSEMQLEANNT